MAKTHLTIPLTCIMLLVLEYAAWAQQEQRTSGSANATIVEPISVSALDEPYLQQFAPHGEQSTGIAPSQLGTSQDASSCFPRRCVAGTTILRVHSGERRGYQVLLPSSIDIPALPRQPPLLVAVHRESADMKRLILADRNNEASDSSTITIEGVVANFSSAQVGHYHALLPVLVIFE